MVQDDDLFFSTIFTQRASRRLSSAALLKARNRFTMASPLSAPGRLALPVRHRLRLRRLPGRLGWRASLHMKASDLPFGWKLVRKIDLHPIYHLGKMYNYMRGRGVFYKGFVISGMDYYFLKACAV